jgi:septal ring factor EnvC (AmiA/AmiB activator)
MTMRYSALINATAIAVLAAFVALLVPAVPANADGAASTRNIILGGALAGGTLLILNHNKKVHQKEAEISNARDQAISQRDAAYANESALRRQLTLENKELASLKHQVARQNVEIRRLRKQVAAQPPSSTAFIQPLTKPPSIPAVKVASESYGWGTL